MCYEELSAPRDRFIDLDKPAALWNLFRTAIQGDDPGITYCIIDGLRELDDQNIAILLDLFSHPFRYENCMHDGSPLKVLITSRDGPWSEKYGHIDLDA
jgi:hypothetical protein